MIAADQPTIFGGNVRAAVSSSSDGMMKVSIHNTPDVNEKITQNITALLEQIEVPVAETNYFVVEYDRPDFKRYSTVAHPPTPLAKNEFDGLATNTPGTALFLPLADCTGAILYDPIHHAVMLSHLGRHSTEQKGAAASVRYMAEQFGSNPADVLAWLGPSPNGEIYPLWARDNMSLIDANRADLLEAGVTLEHIEACASDTATGTDYFSHSEFLKGNRQEDGRFAVVALLE